MAGCPRTGPSRAVRATIRFAGSPTAQPCRLHGAADRRRLQGRRARRIGASARDRPDQSPPARRRQNLGTELPPPKVPDIRITSAETRWLHRLCVRFSRLKDRRLRRMDSKVTLHCRRFTRSATRQTRRFFARAIPYGSYTETLAARILMTIGLGVLAGMALWMLIDLSIR